jgi:hypothetical protein
MLGIIKLEEEAIDTGSRSCKGAVFPKLSLVGCSTVDIVPRIGSDEREFSWCETDDWAIFVV